MARATLQSTLHMLILASFFRGRQSAKQKPSLWPLYWTTCNKEKPVSSVKTGLDEGVAVQAWLLLPYVDMGQSSEWCYSTGGCDNASQALRRPQTSMPFFAVSDVMWRPPAGNQPTVHLCLCGAFILAAPPAWNSLSGHLDVSWRVQGRSWDAECVKVFKVEIRVDVSTAACFL